MSIKLPYVPNWLFVDGSSLIFRAFHGVPLTMRTPNGHPINAVRGFMDTLARVMFARRPGRVAIASDEDWRPAWRVSLLPSYKAHRTAEPVPPLLEPQMPHVHRVLAAIGLDFVGAPELEAEDVIASWTSQAEGMIEVLSGDRDLFGLIRDGRVTVLYPERGGLTRIDEAEVERRFGIPGRAYWDFAVLRGDPSDGLPGLAGVGPKKAAELVRRFGGVEGLLASGSLSEREEGYLRRAWRVACPPEDMRVPLPGGRRDRYPAHPVELEQIGKELGLGTSSQRLVDALKSIA
jgi:5'-3' exonuclease